MTLALYGKTRRRQGGLILAGLLAVLAAVLFAVASMGGGREAQGLTLGSAPGTWLNTTATGGNCPPVIAGSAINWGDAAVGGGCGTQSGYLWEGVTGPVVFSPGVDFPLGKFTHFNNPISGSSLLTASLGLSLSFTDPVQPNVPLTFGFVHQETPNQAPCEFGATNGPCNDRVGVTNPTNPTFQVGENIYTLNITGFRGVPNDGAACPAVPPPGNVQTFVTAEQATNRACIYAQLTFVSPVIDINKTAPNSTVAPPAPVVYSIAVTNNGTGPATNVMFTDNLPQGLTWTETSPNANCTIDTAAPPPDVLNCTIPTLTAGTSAIVTLTSSATSVALCGPYPNTASITSPAHGTDSDSETVTVTCPPPTRTIRVVKVTDTVTHPGAAFAGTISDAVAPDNAWNQTLGANAVNSGNGEINTVSTLAHTVDETLPLPANWAETGYYQVADAGIGTTLCSTTPAQYAGTEAVVAAGTGNVLVCVRNTFTAPTRTIRVVKVTNTAVHPGGAFAGTISPGAAAPNNAWAQSLAANGANSGAGEINAVSTAAHTVDETTIPPNWAESGYYQVADTGSTLCSTTAGDYTGSSIVVGAGTGNVLVCVRNTYTEPTRTIRVVKVTDTPFHPGGTFSGTIAPGGADAANQTWSQSLDADEAASDGETNIVSTGAHTVTENALPPNWANSGYLQASPDLGQSCSATAPGYTGSSIVVAAGTGNVVVCVRNTYTAPTRTVRIQKVTTSAGHPGGAFAGTILPGGTNFDTTWNAMLNPAPDMNSAPGETFITLQTAQTVLEVPPPANWANAGYNVAVDGGQQCSGTEAYGNAGGEVVVPGNASNYLVCVLNTFTPPTRTVRIIKTTDTADHPGGSFAGTILPGQTTPPADTTWDATLAPDAASAPAGTFLTAQTVQTVDENAPPANWFESGYAVIADPTGGATCAGATYAPIPSATVPADAASYLVCVRNTFVASLPTVSKVAATPAFDATHAFYQIIINNTAVNTIERDNIVITDLFSQAELISVSGSGTCGGPLPLAGPWTCNDVAAGQSLTLNIRIPASANPDGIGVCGIRLIDNVISSATLSGLSLTITNGGPGDPERVAVPPVASAECITITKLSTGNGTWTITFRNDGPAATVTMTDTYAPTGADNINSITYLAGGANVPGCTGFDTPVVVGCTPLIAGGTPANPNNTVLVVATDPISIQCGRVEVTNTASFTYNGSPAESSFDDFAATGTDCAVPTVSKVASTPAFDATYAYFQIVIDNQFANAAPRNDILVTDTLPLAELTSTSGSGSCTPATGVGPWDCDGIAAQATLTLNIRVPIVPVAGAGTCLDRTITNDVTAVVGPPDIVPTVSVPAVVVVPGVASADCLSLVKTNTGNGTWDIEIHNTGPATTVFLSDTYVPFQDDVIENVAGCTAAIAVGGLSFTCSVSVLASNGTADPEATVTVTTTALPVGTCEGGGSSNSVTGFFLSPTGAEIGGSPSTDTQTVPVAPGACTVTVNLCKQWTTEPGEQVVGGTEDFTFTVGTNTDVVIEGVEEGGATVCVTLTVTVDEFGSTGLVITENGTVSNGDLTGFETPLVSIGGSSPATSASVTLPLDQCQEPVGAVGQLIGLLRSISFLVVQEPPPPSTTPDCTVLFVNDDTENNLPTGNIQVEKYLDINGDGDANDDGEGPIAGWEMTTTCPNEPVDVQDTNASGVVLVLGLGEAQSCTVTEELPSGWQVTRVTVNGANMGASTSASVTVPGSGATAFVRFYNREVGGITAHKTTVNVLNGIETVNTNDDDGWTITVVSEDCGIDTELDTDASGNAVFSGLPMCTDYVVSEVPGSGAPGYTPVGPIVVSPVTPTVGGATQVNFTNETRSTTPPCPNCSGGTPTPSPTPPTATATPGTPTATSTPGTPTSTPGTPTVPAATATSPAGGSSPTAVSTIAGQRTPGPGQTPVAPSAGDGGSSDAPGGNVLLILAGLGALASGIAFMAMGRKRRA